MIGQRKTLGFIGAMIEGDKYPQFSIIRAPEGHGKKLLVNWIADRLCADVYRPEEKKVDDIRAIIKDSQSIVGRRLYFIEDADNLTPQAQNAILKLAEEPPKNAFVVMTMVDMTYTLPTIISRAKVIEMEPYSRCELVEYISTNAGASKREVEEAYSDLLDISANMGMVSKLRMNDYDEIVEFCEKIHRNIDRISIVNSFNIPRYLEGGGHGEEYSIDIFMMLLGEAFKEDYQRCKVIAKYKPLFRNKGINKQNLVLMMLLEMKGEYSL